MATNQGTKTIWEASGYCYPNNKNTGKEATLLATDQGIVVTQDSAMPTRRARGLSGMLASKIVDAVANKNAGSELYDVSYAEIENISPAKSMMTGSGLLVTLKNGEQFKFSSAHFAMGGLKKNYPEVKATLAQVAPGITFGDVE